MVVCNCDTKARARADVPENGDSLMTCHQTQSAFFKPKQL